MNGPTTVCPLEAPPYVWCGSGREVTLSLMFMFMFM